MRELAAAAGNAARILAAILILGGAMPVSAASNVDGHLYGRVHSADPPRSMVVLVESQARGVRREAAVEESGAFRVPLLPPGRYRVSLRRDGETLKIQDVTIALGSGTRVVFEVAAAGEPDLIPVGDATELDQLVVTGTPIAPIDFSQTEAAISFTEQQLDPLPVPRHVTSVALLAPGTVQGDRAFGNLASFGGSSSAENVYFVNGFNITDFRTGTGFSTVPFEFLNEFQVKTGGYGAQFGRSTGGVVNSTTKRGGHVWEGGLAAVYEPAGMRENQPSSVQPNGAYAVDNRRDSLATQSYNLYAGGPALRDRLFVYGMVDLNEREQFEDRLTRGERQESDTPFYGFKADWNLVDDQLFELTVFSDEHDNVVSTFDDVPTSPHFGALIGVQTRQRGGENVVARYTARFGDVAVSGLFGNGEFKLSDIGNRDHCPLAIDTRSGSTELIGCWIGSGFISRARDERTAWRLDAEWAASGVAGEHVLRVGGDFEDNQSFDRTTPSGGVVYVYLNVTPGDSLGGSTVPPGVTEVVEEEVFRNGGDFTTRTTAFYLEDTWQVTERLNLYLGLRNESFDNRDANGNTFVRIDDQLAPRLGVSWDALGRGTSRVFMNLGRYHLPVAANTNIRLAGGELFTIAYFQCGTGISPEPCTYDPADGSPTNRGAQIGETDVFGDGSVRDRREIVDQDIEPMYQDELIAGVQAELFGRWLGGLRFIHRDLRSSLEDVTVNHALRTYAVRNGLPTSRLDDPTTPAQYVLANPGQGITMSYDFDGDGTLEPVSLTPDDLDYPEVTRKYNAAELFFERLFDGTWFLQGSYTWSQSYGNSEGWVRSDNGQADAGLTTQFDYPGLTDGAHGYLPNDRRHKLKLYASYHLTQEWQPSFNLLAQSGRPVNAFGIHPTDPGAASYGAASFYEGGTLAPRGSRGRTATIYQLDVGLRWAPLFMKSLRLGLDVFNVTGEDEETEVFERTQRSGGAPDGRYKRPQEFQEPRAVRFQLEYLLF